MKNNQEIFNDSAEFENEMISTYPDKIREIVYEEELSDGRSRFTGWLKFPYYSDDSCGGFFTFFDEEEFHKWASSAKKMPIERVKNNDFEVDQYYNELDGSGWWSLTEEDRYNSIKKLDERLNEDK